MWLRANKLSLNVEKTKLVLFQRQNTKLNNSFKFKPDGKRLFPTTSVKYLGVLLDEHLTWSPQISHVQMKLDRAIGILSKLRYQPNIHILKMVYHSLFGTHLLYACQLWGQKNKETQNQFRTFQDRALKKIAFKNRYESEDPFYKSLKIIKFQDLLQLNNCLRVNLNKIKNYQQLFLDLYTLKESIATTQEVQEKLLIYPSLPNLHLCMGCNYANTNALKIGTD